MNNSNLNRLYQKYSGVCVDRNTYEYLEKSGKISNKLKNIYPASYGHLSAGYTNASAKIGPYKGSVPAQLAGYGESLFFENWDKYSKNNNECMLIYNDFLVICPVPEMDIIGGNFKKSRIDPVVIPLCRVKKIEISEGKSSRYELLYNLTIIFSNGMQYTAVLFTKASYSNAYSSKGTYLQGINWSFETNQFLTGHKLSYTPGYEQANQNFVANYLRSFVDKATNYDELMTAVIDLECGVSLTKKIIPEIYKGEKDFLLFLLSLKDEIKKKAKNKFFVEKLEELSNEFDKIGNKRKNLKKQIDDAKDEIEKKRKELDEMGFFQLLKNRGAVKELEEKCEQLINDLDKLYVSSDCYDELKKALLSTSKNNKYNSDEQKLGVELYNVCKNKNVIKLETDEEKILFDTICKSMNIPTRLRTVEFFEFGKKSSNKKLEDSFEFDYGKIMSRRLKAEEIYNEELIKSRVVGKDKYLSKIASEIKSNQAKMEIADLGYRMGLLKSNTQAVKSDAYLLGGMASGLAGGAVGLATFSDINAKNAQAEVDAANVRERGRKLMDTASSAKSEFSRSVYDLKKKTKKISDRLCDTDHADLYFDYLQCDVVDYVVEMSGVLLITAEINFKKEPVFNDLPIAIDGSLIIDILANEKVVGKAYLCAPGFDELDIDKVGFNNCSKYNVIGIPEFGDFEDDIEYEFVFRPLNVWMIEK